jgi:hypothetical protein
MSARATDAMGTKAVKDLDHSCWRIRAKDGERMKSAGQVKASSRFSVAGSKHVQNTRNKSRIRCRRRRW